MADNRISGKSVAAFLFMPQFRLSFEGFSHIVPVFMRLLALVFVQAGLIPRNHPATRYGAEGVEKYSFARLMGEGWYTLRTTKASVQQWCSYMAVVIMLSVTAVSVVGTVATLAVGLNNAAQAQLFTIQGTDTSMSSVQNGAGSGIFDSSFAGAVGSKNADYARAFLDKVLRQGMVGGGAALQRGMGALFQVYNTAMLAIAGLMVFWMVVTVVADTAKTGTIGGGRHNMVWAPIRIVFALSLMIPLGASGGFSVGQFMVAKLAEWGSNLGTNGWSKYVEKVVTDDTLLATYSEQTMSVLIHDLLKIKVCQVSYNAAVAETTDPGSDSMIVAKEMNPFKAAFKGGGVVPTAFEYANDTDNYCGTVMVPGSISWADVAKGAAVAVSPAMGLAAFTPSSYEAAAERFNQEYKKSLANFIQPSGFMKTALEPVACDVASQMFTDKDATSPTELIGCAKSSGFPQGDKIAPLMKQADQIIKNGMSAGRSVLQSYISKDMLPEMKARGWGGMGLWYSRITSLNGLLSAARDTNVVVSPGKAWSWATDCGEDQDSDKCDDADLSSNEQKVASAIYNYDRWWDRAITQGDLNAKASSISEKIISNDKSETRGMIDAPSKDSGMASRVAKLIGDEGTTSLWLNEIKINSGIYPIAQVAASGHSLISIGTTIIGAVTAVQIIGGFFNSGFAQSALIQSISTIGSTLLVCGMVLAFYLPIIPFIRASFAVLTWIISVFEAVVMVPVAALAHLNTEGEGITGGARSVWILWLNVLFRPILTVIGFIGAILVYNTFILFWHETFIRAASVEMNALGWFKSFLASIAYAITHLAVTYTACNTVFKMLDVIPNALMKWLGGPQDHSFDNHSDEGMLLAGSNLLGRMSFNPKGPPQQPQQPTPPSPTTGAQQSSNTTTS